MPGYPNILPVKRLDHFEIIGDIETQVFYCNLWCVLMKQDKM